MSAKTDLSADYARSLLAYDPGTGKLVWRVNRMAGRHANVVMARAGDEAGYRAPYGVTVRIDRKLYAAHRLAWLIVHGSWPAKMLDHVNGDPHDNRLENLREASAAENQRNHKRRRDNTSGVKGVWFSKQTNKWVAEICVGGVKHSLGHYHTKECAALARWDAAQKLHGDFASTGNRS